MIILVYLAFLVLTGLGISYINARSKICNVPYGNGQKMKCSGLEMFMIFLYATGLLGLLPLLAVRLAVLEVLCIWALFKSPDRPVISFPFLVFILFLFWILYGLTYTTSVNFGIRMTLKYLYPFLVALLASAVVRDGILFIKCGIAARITAIVSLALLFLPFCGFMSPFFWNSAAIVTHYITIFSFSLGLYFFTKKKYKLLNLLFSILFVLPCFLRVYRTDIMGSGIALAAFFFVRYRFKSIPLIIAVGMIFVLSLFYVPSVKQKMYHRPDEVTLEDFLTNNVDENNFNDDGRDWIWEKVQTNFYDDHELTGSGTGRVQKYMYTEDPNLLEGAQLHNDFLVLMCDNGLIGLTLYILTYISMLLHIAIIYRKNRDPYLRLCCTVAGASLLGVMATMYSDNTLSYSMATLSYPWGFYGMTLGLNRAHKQNNPQIANYA